MGFGTDRFLEFLEFLRDLPGAHVGSDSADVAPCNSRGRQTRAKRAPARCTTSAQTPTSAEHVRPQVQKMAPVSPSCQEGGAHWGDVARSPSPTPLLLLPGLTPYAPTPVGEDLDGNAKTQTRGPRREDLDGRT